MKLEVITEGLKNLLLENNYSPATIHFYEREWKKISAYLEQEYNDTEFDMERGLKYLEHQYGFISNCKDQTLTQQRVQLLRVVHMLEDYRLHKVLTRRYYASKNPLVLNPYFSSIQDKYQEYLETTELSFSTKEHYSSFSMVFMDYLTQTKILTVEQICMDHCNGYLKTLAGYSF